MRVHRSTTTPKNTGSGLSPGDPVRHRREPSLGEGAILEVGHGPKPLLVAWSVGLETYHATGELERILRTGFPEVGRAA